MSVVATQECAVRSARLLVETFAEEKMCRKCVPCVLSVAQITSVLSDLSAGSATSGDTERLLAFCDGMDETAMCKLGRDVAIELKRLLGEHSQEFTHHESGSCPSGGCTSLLTFTVVGEKCTLCGACKEICPAGAVVGEKPLWYVADSMPFRIRADKCTGCGLCVPVCEPGAIVLQIGGDSVG